MTRPFVTVSAVLLALASCGPQQGVGFTGIGSEPAGAAAAMREAEPRTYAPAAGAGLPAASAGRLPLHRAEGAAGTEAQLAQAAMAAAGRSESAAAAVMLGTQGAMASLVDAGPSRFLVVRRPRGGGSTAFGEGAGRAFLASVQPLTNCGTGQTLYRGSGTGAAADALAVALECD